MFICCCLFPLCCRFYNMITADGGKWPLQLNTPTLCDRQMTTGDRWPMTESYIRWSWIRDWLWLNWKVIVTKLKWIIHFEELKTAYKHFIIKISSYRAHRMKNKQKRKFQAKENYFAQEERNMFVILKWIKQKTGWWWNLGHNHMETKDVKNWNYPYYVRCTISYREFIFFKIGAIFFIF